MRSTKFIFLLSLLIFTILFCFNVSAEQITLGIFKVEDCVKLIQNCGNCSFVNITSVLYPNSTSALSQVSLTKIGTIYNHTFCSTSALGTYIVNGFGDPDGFTTPFTYDFIINPLGKNLTNSQAILYFLIFTIALIFFVICISLGIYIPSGNKRDEMTGYVIAVENTKYVKVFLLCLSYITFTIMIYFAWIISYGYLDLDFLGRIFNFLFYGLIALILPLFIVGVFVIISNVVKDSKINYALTRGFKIK